MPIYTAVGGLWVPRPPAITLALAFTSSVIDATGEKFAWIGRHWNSARATKSIRRVGFRFGTVTKAGGSGLTVSLQDVSAGTPDGTQDQTVAIANGDAGFASNLWYRTGALSADRSVAFGALLSVVVEYDGSGRLGSDAVNFNNLGVTVPHNGFDGAPSLLTGSWAAVNAHHNCVLEYDDGTFGCLEATPVSPISALTASAFNSGSGADERALRFRLPFNCKIDGTWVYMVAAASATFDIVLYEGTTAKATVTVDRTASTTNPRVGYVPIPETEILANTTYYLALKPTSANNVTLSEYSVNDANHFAAVPDGSTEFQLGTRVDAGAWTDTTTSRPFMGIRISAIDIGSGGGIRLAGVGGLAA